MTLILRCFGAIRRTMLGADWSKMSTHGWVRTDHLVCEPSFLSGTARVIDLFGQYDGYNISLTPRQADAIALYSDWRTIGQDLWQTMEHARQNISADTVEPSLLKDAGVEEQAQ